MREVVKVTRESRGERVTKEVPPRVAKLMCERHGWMEVKETAEVVKKAAAAVKSSEKSLKELKQSVKAGDREYVDSVLENEKEREKPRASVIEAAESRLVELDEENGDPGTI
jgi:hypothetical protein